ncbi:transporter substrate-binding domain-containing protein [Pseudomonas rhodesiae]|uniref:Transporter substrate-binding domain-containing protein n=1 Tax=Pseudomonas rhodesiae TaxID=76760 RepID=A0A8I1E8F1_9PSED|nr:transporter substrate-binding domain-containing protein [Pseudomonas rhodesiae]MBI6626700.1 transporter substrate-binding domain-containing protein [Pseudomonas rhodesiae]
MNKRIGRVLVSGFAFLLVSIGVDAADAPVATPPLRFGTALGYPPFEYLGSDGKMTGFEIDLGNAICEKLKRVCQWQDIEFSSMTPALKARKFDAFIASVAVTDDRLKQVAFSDKVYSGGTRLLAHKGAKLIPDDAMASGKALAGKRIGVEQGTINEKFAKKRWALEGVEVVSYRDQDLVYNDLMTGRLDGAIVAGIQAQIGFLSSDKGVDYEFAGKPIEDSLIGRSYSAIAVNQGNQALLDNLNRAIAELHADGTYQRITDKYFPPNTDIYGE